MVLCLLSLLTAVVSLLPGEPLCTRTNGCSIVLSCELDRPLHVSLRYNSSEQKAWALQRLLLQRDFPYSWLKSASGWHPPHECLISSHPHTPSHKGEGYGLAASTPPTHTPPAACVASGNPRTLSGPTSQLRCGCLWMPSQSPTEGLETCRCPVLVMPQLPTSPPLGTWSSSTVINGKCQAVALTDLESHGGDIQVKNSLHCDGPSANTKAPECCASSVPTLTW